MPSHKIDTEKLLQSVDIVGVIQKYLPLQKNGREFVACCPFHDERTPSFKVNQSKQIFKCFGCGEGGNAIDFVMKYTGVGFLDAARELQGGAFQFDAKQLHVAERKETRKKHPSILPVPGGVNLPEVSHYQYGVPHEMWHYHNETGALNFVVCRWNRPGGKKEIMPYSYTEVGWRFQKPSAPCPIYGLQELRKKPDAVVCLFEGEKAARFARKLMTKAVCMSWVGGTNGHKTADFSPIKNRIVFLFPDNDDPGRKVMAEIGQMLEKQGCSVFWIEPLKGTPKGWDIADKEWDMADLGKWVEGRVQFANRPKPQKKERKKPSPKPKPQPEDPPSAIPMKKGDGTPFEILGYEKAQGGDLSYYFYVHASGKTISRTVSQMSETNLYLLAPLQWWEGRFSGESRSKWHKPAVNWLIQLGHQKGIFDDELIRGRGAWMDRDKVVIHAGDVLIVDGQRVGLDQFQTSYIYEREKSISLRMPKPLSKADAYKYLNLCKRLSWDRPVNAYLLAGWVVVAAVCGALRWRPHIWVTGAKGTGKSTIMRDYVRRMLGRTCLFYEGDTTEAGIRQTLKMDALPVVFDESEGDTAKSAANMESILRLVRSMSFDSGARIVKGSGSGVAKTFSLKSCFAFSSIGVSAYQGADLSRITILGLDADRSKDAREKWKQTQKEYNALVTDEYVDRILSRTIKMLPVIRDNAAVFTSTFVDELRDQRLGDQLGILAAGAFSLASDGRIEKDKALEWIRAHEWDQERQTEAMRDEVLLVNFVMDTTVRFQAQYGTAERSVAELVVVAAKMKKDSVLPEKADEILKRNGLKVADGHLYVCNNHKWLVGILRDTAWSRNPNRILERLDGAEKVGTMRFAATTNRATKIPLESIGLVGDDQPAAVDDDPENLDLPF